MTTATAFRSFPLMPPSSWTGLERLPMAPEGFGDDIPFNFEIESKGFGFDPELTSLPAGFASGLAPSPSCTPSPVLPINSVSSGMIVPIPVSSISSISIPPSVAPSSSKMMPVSGISGAYGSPRSPITTVEAVAAAAAAATASIPTQSPALALPTHSPISPAFLYDQHHSIPHSSSQIPSTSPLATAATAATAAWFDPALGSFDSQLGPGPGPGPVPGSAPYSYVSVPAQSPMVGPLSHPVTAFGSMPTASYPLAVVSASLDFSAGPSGAGAMVNPLATLSTPPTIPNPYLLPPHPAVTSTVVSPSSGVSFDGLLPMVSTLSHSPELSPILGTVGSGPMPAVESGCGSLERSAKRQRTSAMTCKPTLAVPISPNLLSDANLSASVGGRNSAKGSRQDSVEAEDRKGMCPIPECGRVFKDLKAHILTHQTERPEKCPITTCEYHLKGFARKYDKNRHTLTHYRGTMVCIFCPGSGSTAEQTFNRVDAFKKHLTVAHGVEQAPPNSRKRNSSGRPIVQTQQQQQQPGNGSVADSVPHSAISVAGSENGPSDALCSTCSLEFRNPQDFYEHLDDCVLRVVQKLDPAEMFNERNLGTVNEDENVVQALARHNLPTEGDTPLLLADDDQDDNSSDAGKGSETGAGQQQQRAGAGAAAGPQLSSRRRRRNYPTSWGCSADKMNMKKRVVCVYDGPERIFRDPTIVNRDHDVRVKLADGKSFITDMEAFLLDRAEDTWNARHGIATGTELGLPVVPGLVEGGSDLSEEYHPLYLS